MNLVVNARGAMPRGGQLTISARDVFLDEEYVGQLSGVWLGRYVRLTVSDTWCRRDKTCLPRICEPLFTTKPVSTGTGLGLAMVYCVVKASGGHLTVESEPGDGTTFHLFFPVVDGPDLVAQVPSRHTQSPGSETVLLVEDEQGVRTLAR